MTPTLGVSSVAVAAARVSPPARLSRGAVERAQVAAPAQPGYAWSPNPVTLPGQRPNPLLAQLGPVGNAIVKLAVFPRNEFLYQRFDLAPTVKPFVVPEAPDATTVNGTLNAATQIGDPISVEVIAAPTYGTVTVTDDGFFTYTPHEALAGAPGADTFTAKVTDDSYHLGKVIGKIFGIPDRSTTVDVPISWNNLAPAPPGGKKKYDFAIWNYTGYTIQVTLGGQQATVSAPYDGQVFADGEAAYVTMEDPPNMGKDKESTYFFDEVAAGPSGITPDNNTYPDFKTSTKLEWYEDNVGHGYQKVTKCEAYSGSCEPSGTASSNHIFLYS